MGGTTTVAVGVPKQLEESDNADFNIIEGPTDPEFSRAAKVAWHA